MIEKVYIVTAGSYSDYHIAGVFTDKALADRFASKHRWGDAEVGTWQVNPVEEQLHSGREPYVVYIDKEGKVSCEMDWNAISDVQEYGVRSDGYDGYGRLRLVVFAKDEQHAAKIANERRTQIIANNMWGKE